MEDTSIMKTITDRRATIQEQIDFYLHQAKLARMGLTTRRTEEFFLRQAEYFRTTAEA